MKHSVTQEDNEFGRQIERCEFPVADFDHRAHVRLAYIYLVQADSARAAVDLMRSALVGLLRHAGVDPSGKYHETLTEAWVLAVDHFMNKTESSNSADEFIDQNPLLLDSGIMQSHYSAELLFSDEARRKFVEPNREPIPRY
ncbi:hypothetical protein FV139_09730 [Parahaliea maris]|uniref:Uncharacterized protein n=1 Tax=Parahaliea maris TaxID=2716870 RepID=A0A5C9A2Q4_9GAMM|nr:hypothetical protein [Parahaliea maris]TXS93897.1 hypothetical protein FV139_09730 [Parahaliea maris]